MAEATDKPKPDKPAGAPKLTIKVNDVSPADKTAPEPSAKPIIVTNRPMIKDPMVKEEDKKETEAEPKAEVKHELKLQVETAEEPKEAEPAAAPVEESPEATPEPEPPAEKPDEPEEPAAEVPPAEEESKDESKKDEPKDAEAIEAAAAAKQAEHDAAIQKLADGKQYYLPINAVEKRRSRRFVLLGVVISLLLILAWADIALDAGLVHISNIKPITHFFSN